MEQKVIGAVVAATRCYTEHKPDCDLYYYELNYPIWSEYDWNYVVNSCDYNPDTLTIKDFNSENKVIFVRIKGNLLNEIVKNAKLTKADA